ncbi:MAG: hypothetical protein WCP29_14140 [Acidobacteriota bacterium]
MAQFSSIKRADGQVIEQDSLARRRASIARRLSRLCQACGDRVAQYADPGEAEPDGAPTLCLSCYRDKGYPHPHPHLQVVPQPPRPERTLEVEDKVELSGTDPQQAKQIIDRDQLYTNLRLRRRRAQIAARHASEEPLVEAPADVTRVS